ncbi:MAG: hypothetical protein EOO45_25280 [Flavobacterium sp.]|nr:MAG: hypothetical protein EOO45_25280 [Flavobacterium sp.]
MKVLQLLLLLFTCGINAFAQSNETFRLSTDKPETGKDIGFFYSFSPTKMSRQFIYLIYQKGEHIQQISLQGKYSRGRIEGKFRLPDSVYSFRIQPDKRPNGTEVFIFQVHKKGEPVKGSYAPVFTGLF